VRAAHGTLGPGGASRARAATIEPPGDPGPRRRL